MFYLFLIAIFLIASYGDDVLETVKSLLSQRQRKLELEERKQNEKENKMSDYDYDREASIVSRYLGRIILSIALFFALIWIGYSYLRPWILQRETVSVHQTNEFVSTKQNLLLRLMNDWQKLESQNQLYKDNEVFVQANLAQQAGIVQRNESRNFYPTNFG